MAQDILPTNTQALLIQSLGDLEPMVLTVDHPIIDRISVETDASGLSTKQPILTGYGGGVSGTFADSLAHAKVNAANAEAFDIEPAIVYGQSIIDWSSSRYTKGKSSAIDVAILNTKAAMENARDNFAKMIFGDGSGVLARIGTATNTSGNLWTLTLTVLTDVGYFKQDMVLKSKLTPFAASLDTGEAIVTGMNHLGGQIYVDVGATSMVPTAGHYIGLKGQIAASTDVMTFPGIQGYIPSVANRTNGIPNVTPFLGVPRGIDSAGVAVSGWAFNVRDKPLFTGMNSAAGFMSNFKDAKPTQAFINGADMPKVAQELDQKVRYDMPSRSGNAQVLYMGFDVGLSTGKCEVLADPACPAGTMILTRSDQWTLRSPGKLFAPASNGQILVQSYDENIARCSVECSGMFTTSNPPATANLTLY